MISPTSAGRVGAWIADDPDERDPAELRALLADDSPAAGAELADRFAGRLEFGTAGLRGAVAAGPNRMNRAVVRGATAALAGWLARTSGQRRRGGALLSAATPGTDRTSSPMRRPGCSPGRACGCTCCRRVSPRRCWRSRSDICLRRPAS